MYSGKSVLKPHPPADVVRRLEIVRRLNEEEMALEEKIRRKAHLEISQILDEKKEKVNKLKIKCGELKKIIERLRENFSKTPTTKLRETIEDHKHKYNTAIETVKRTEMMIEEERRYLEANIEDFVRKRLVDTLLEKQEDLKRLNEFMKEKQGDTVHPRTPGTPGSRPTRLQSRVVKPMSRSDEQHRIFFQKVFTF